MLFRHLRLLGLLATLALQTTPPAGDPPAGDPPAGDPPQNDPPVSDPPLGDAGKAALDAERKARRDAEKAAKDARDELDRLRKEATDRADKEAEEQGRWKELAEKREADLSTANDTLTSTQERLDAALKVITDTVAASWKDVPEEVRDLYDGPDDDPLAKQTFLAKPATQKLIERLTDKTTTPGNGPNPKPSDGKRDLKAAEQRSRHRYTV